MNEKQGQLPVAVLLLLALATISVRIYPAFLGSFPDPDHYYHLRQMEYVAQAGQVRSFDELSNLGRPYTYYPLFHMVGGTLAVLFGVPALWAYAFVSLLFSLLGVLAVYCLARTALARCGVSTDAAQFSALCAAALPIFFLRQGIFGRPDAFAPAAVALAFLFLFQRSAFGMAALGAFLALLHPYSLLVVGGLLALAVFLDWLSAFFFKSEPAFASPHGTPRQGAVSAASEFLRSKAVLLLAVFALSALVAATYYLRLPLSDLATAHTFRTSSEMQPSSPVSVLQLTGPALILCVIAVLKSFGVPEKPRTTGSHWLVAASVASSALMFLASRNMAYAAVPIAVLAAFGLSEAQAKTERFAPLLWAVCGIAALSSLYCALNVQSGQYSGQQLAGLAYLSSLPQAPVVALWDRGHPLAEISKKQVVVDGYFEFEPKLDEKVTDVQLLFTTGSASTVDLIARKYGAGYLYFDNKTRSVFDGDRNAFARTFLSPGNSTRLDLIFDSGDARVFRVN
jgi:hypothetical protein